MYRFGDIVLIEFPFSNNSISKKRPALILYDFDDDDILVARITTQVYQTEFDIKLSEWQKTNLLSESFLRLHKLATLSKSLINKKLGRIDDADLSKIKELILKTISEIDRKY